MRAPTISRRNLVALLGGSATGLLLTPVPWKLVDDAALWTQNWRFTPKLPRGPVETRFTACGVCPAGCALRVSTVAGVPFRIAAASAGGALCPVAFGAHQLAWHPSRARGPVALEAITTDVARAALGAAASGRRVAILDARPGRSVSLLYRRFLSGVPGGLYLTAPRSEARSLDLLASMIGRPDGSLGWDLDRAETILSFGAPILDGWTGSAAVVARRRAGGGPRVIQAETRLSRTAAAADTWLPIAPGAVAPLALAIAHVIVREGWAEAASPEHRTLIDVFPPDRAAETTGLRPEKIVETARAFALDGPSLAVGGGDPGGGPLGYDEEVAVQALNLLRGARGSAAGVSGRDSLPAPAVLDRPDACETRDVREACEESVAVLILDGAPSGEALPWPWIERVLAKDAIVVSLSPYLTGAARRATHLVPSPAPFEALEEAATPPGSARASFAVTAPLRPAAPGAVDPVEFLRGVAAATGVALPGSGGVAPLVESRAKAIHARGRGDVLDPASGEAKPLASFASAEDFWKAILGGASWRDRASSPVTWDRADLPGATARLREIPGEAPPGVALVTFGLAGAVGEGPVSPLVSKVYRETRLRTGPGRAVLHPETASKLGVHDGARIVVTTDEGSVTMTAAIDETARPGVLFAAAGPDPDRLGEAGAPIGDAPGEAIVALRARAELAGRAPRARVREA